MALAGRLSKDVVKLSLGDEEVMALFDTETERDRRLQAVSGEAKRSGLQREGGSSRSGVSRPDKPSGAARGVQGGFVGAAAPAILPCPPEARCSIHRKKHLIPKQKRNKESPAFRRSETPPSSCLSSGFLPALSISKKRAFPCKKCPLSSSRRQSPYL